MTRLFSRRNRHKSRPKYRNALVNVITADRRIIKMLLNTTARIKNKSARNPLGEPFCEAVARGNLESIDILFSHGAGVHHVSDACGMWRTLLRIATDNNELVSRLEIVAMLVRHGVEIPAALYFAVHKDRTEIVNLLLLKRFDPGYRVPVVSGLFIQDWAVLYMMRLIDGQFCGNKG
jgi:hypothetical protein